ncbi:hypothetical protein [Caballeronia sp. S22]|uniref:hypothetical protein n=1 Tax=Caballeronia sp. S22 TaxID=3137182 RepID=UPI003531696E
MAHHLAELIADADSASGAEKAATEQRAVDLILKLWAHRRALPETVDPLGGFRDAIAVLARMSPEANPWARFRHRDDYAGLLHEMFKTLSRTVVAGILLTQVQHARPITDTEAVALDDEEKLLFDEFEQWNSFLSRPVQRPGIEIRLVDSDTIEEEGESDDVSDDVSEAVDHDADPEAPVKQAESSMHSVILANLESMQSELGELLSRWKQSTTDASDDGDEADEDF